MTEEKAIEILQGAIKKPNTKDGYLGQAIDMAIKALEQKLATKSDLGVDCISRESVLKLIYDYKENHSNDREHYPINYGTLLDMIRWVSKLPPVTPQEPIFNKIRAEIEQTHETMDGFIMHEGTKKTVLSIIDKYKAESEKI